MHHDLETIVAHFQMQGAFASALPFGGGHINDTYVITINHRATPVRYLLQRINHHVFRDPVTVMENIRRITEHLRSVMQARGITDADRRALTVVPTKQGDALHRDPQGNYWRVYRFIEKATSHDVAETEEQAYQAAKAFGSFQQDLAGLTGGGLAETIPHFHDTGKRYTQLQAALNAGSHERARKACPEIEFARSRQPIVQLSHKLRGEGLIPERIAHNDAKLNNVLLDPDTNEALCVVDLDTVMPGLSLYDFGDLVRSCTNPAKEDERDLSMVTMRMAMFEALARGYLQGAGELLTKPEIDHLALSGKLIAFELGLRFLTDYLRGDTYFKADRAAHNLDRCRVQFKLVESMEQRQEAMERVVEKMTARG